MLLSSVGEVLTIGIFGSNGKTSTANMLSSIFNNAGLAVHMISDKIDVMSKRNMANIEIYKKLKNAGNNDIIIIEITDSLLKNKKLYGIDFDMLVHCRISEGSYESSTEGMSRINSIMNSSKNIKTVILNTDDANWRNILIDLENTYLITYGLGNKATVTASSIECSTDIRFCYCLQRALTCFNAAVIEPMEMPVVLKSLGQYNVYNGLAAITSAIVSGIHPDSIVSSLANTVLGCGLRIAYSNGFKVIDNKCDRLLSFETGFEAVQNMPCKRIILVFNLRKDNNDLINNKIFEVIGTWSLILRAHSVYLLDSGDGVVSGVGCFEDLRSSLNDQGINAEVINIKTLDVEKLIDFLMEKDMLLFFCTGDLDYIREKIIEVLDRRILGEIPGSTA